MSLFNKISKLIPTAIIAISASQLSAAELKIKFVTEPGFEPFEYFDKNGNLAGFDIDLMNAMCKKLNATCSMDTTEFDAIIPSILLKKYDVGLAGFSVTDERKQTIAYSDLYLNPEPAIFIFNKKVNINSIKQITKKHKLATQSGTTQLDYLNAKGYNAKGYDKFTNIILDIESGRLDGMLVDVNVGTKFLAENPNLKQVGGYVQDPIISQGTAMVLNKKNTELLGKINKVLNELKKDGTIDKLKAKYDIH